MKTDESCIAEAWVMLFPSLQNLSEEERVHLIAIKEEVIPAVQELLVQLAQPKNREIKKDLSPETVPIQIEKGITLQQLYTTCQQHFPCWTNLSLDLITPNAPDQSYLAWVRNSDEADEEFRNKSAEDLRGVATMTATERLLFELEFFLKTGKHLDIKGMTLCPNSRTPDGNSIVIRWSNVSGELWVYSLRPTESAPDLRARRVERS